MSVDGSPDSLRLFGLSKNIDSSQDLFKTQSDLHDGERNVGSSQSIKRPCFRTPNRNSNPSVRSLTATVANSVAGIYCSQERKSSLDSLDSNVWSAMKCVMDDEVVESYNVKNVLNGQVLYHGKVAHLAVLIKSVEALSQRDTSLVLYDNSGEIKAVVHKKVMEKYGALLEPGSGILLRQCTAFSFISVQKYINITLPNIVHIFNSTSLVPPQEIVDKHMLEVSEINVLKEEHPDTENQTPNVVINTPNRPPPPRSSYSKQSTPHTPAAPPKPGTPVRADLTPRARSSYPIMTPNRGFSRGTPRPSTRDPTSIPHTPERNKYHTPVRKSMHIFRDPIHQPRDNSTGTSSFGANQNDLLKTPEPKKRSNPDEVGSSKRTKTSTPPSTSSRKPVISPKEQEEIDKLLAGIDDSFFDDF